MLQRVLRRTTVIIVSLPGDASSGAGADETFLMQILFLHVSKPMLPVLLRRMEQAQGSANLLKTVIHHRPSHG